MANTPVTNLDFGAQVREWANRTEDKLEAVFKGSFDMTVDAARMGAPIDTGFLRASLITVVGEVPAIDPAAHGKNAKPIVSADVVASAKLGDKLSAGFTAAYARRIEYGFAGDDSLGRTYKQQGKGMVRLAIQRFPEFVQAAINAADAAAGD